MVECRHDYRMGVCFHCFEREPAKPVPKPQELIPDLVLILPSLVPVAMQLETYAEQCADARLWGGPTIYPPNPVNEKTAAEIAKLLRDILKAADL